MSSGVGLFASVTVGTGWLFGDQGSTGVGVGLKIRGQHCEVKACPTVGQTLQ